MHNAAARGGVRREHQPVACTTRGVASCRCSAQRPSARHSSGITGPRTPHSHVLSAVARHKSVPNARSDVLVVVGESDDFERRVSVVVGACHCVWTQCTLCTSLSATDATSSGVACVASSTVLVCSQLHRPSTPPSHRRLLVFVFACCSHKDVSRLRIVF